MKTEFKQRIVRWFALGAGLMDSGTGILLLVAPALALQLMRVPAVPGEALVFNRFIGAFVFAVGSLYLLAWFHERLSGRREGMRWVLLSTGWVRAVVCVFVLTAVSGGTLAPAWLSVALTDGVLALIQAGILYGNWISDEG